ncbi:MAG TPA: 3D domain-containing protein [Kofleriaceae bacterium]|nr:3D domain-containing protein [Kofleriaceae bacterium]
MDGSVGKTLREVASAAREVVVGSMGYLADMVAKIVKRIAGVAPIAVAIACTGPRVDKEPPPAPAATVAPAPTIENKESSEPKPIGKFDITFYYVVGEDEIAAKRPKESPVANDNQPASTELTAVAATPEMVTLYEPKACQPIAEVTREFASQLQLQGTGKLRDGRVLNIWGRCSCEQKPCFKVTENQWGTAGTGKPLQPFRTVAVDPRVIKLGSLLYVPLLEGRTMPGRAPWGGYIHDGCLVADDTGGGIDGHQLDLFVGKKAYYNGLRSAHGGSHAWARHVPVFDGSKVCERKGRHVGRKQAAI